MRRREWWRKLTTPLLRKELWKPCRDTVATGLAVGLFFCLMPMPLQAIFAGTVAMRMRANVPIAMAATWISNPVTNLPIWAGQLWLGNQLQDLLHLPMPELVGTLTIPKLGAVNAATFFLGAGVSSLLAGALAFPLVHLFSAIMPHHLPRLPKRLPRPQRVPVMPSGPDSRSSPK